MCNPAIMDYFCHDHEKRPRIRVPKVYIQATIIRTGWMKTWRQYGSPRFRIFREGLIQLSVELATQYPSQPMLQTKNEKHTGTRNAKTQPEAKRVCLCIYVCMYICIYVYMYICTRESKANKANKGT